MRSLQTRPTTEDTETQERVLNSHISKSWVSYQDLSGPVWLFHCIVCLTRFNPDISKSHKLPDSAANTKGDRLYTRYSTEVTQLLPSFSNWMHMKTRSCLKTKECGCWRSAGPAPTLLQNVWVRFPGPTWQLTPVCNSSSRRSDNLFQPWQAPCTPTQTETFSRGEGLGQQVRQVGG